MIVQLHIQLYNVVTLLHCTSHFQHPTLHTFGITTRNLHSTASTNNVHYWSFDIPNFGGLAVFVWLFQFFSMQLSYLASLDIQLQSNPGSPTDVMSESYEKITLDCL